MTDTTAAPAGKIQPRLKQKYLAEIKTALTEQFGYANVNQVPGLVKVVVNTGVGEAARDSKIIEGAIKDLTAITGQKPQVNIARKSIAQFKLREGQAIGAHVTLRGDRAWEFLDRLVTLALPRIRDFRGLSDKQFDGNGNYTFGLTEQSVFHEIDQDRIDRVRGFDITVVTTAKTDDEGRALLRQLGFAVGQERCGPEDSRPPARTHEHTDLGEPPRDHSIAQVGIRGTGVETRREMDEHHDDDRSGRRHADQIAERELRAPRRSRAPELQAQEEHRRHPQA
jgi:large subunit ribosomal protein L5